jgi:hypothetical protein
MSRDDSGSFLPAYAELDIVGSNPFATIDQKGVGRLMEITRDLGRKTRPTSNWEFAASTAANQTA